MKALENYFSALTNSAKAFGTRPVIPLLKIKGDITPLQTYSVSRSLNEIPLRNVKFLAVVINSSGGAPAQCHIISKKLEAFSRDKNIPIYTFAEDQATSGGYYLLSCGEKVFADGASLVGGIGSVHRHVNFRKALEDHDIYIEKHASSEKPLSNRLSWTEEMTDETRDLVQGILKGTHQQFIEHVKGKRGEKVQGEIQQKHGDIYEGGVFLGRKAKDLGLVDEVANFREYVNVNYPNAKLVNVSRPTMRDRVRLVLSKFIAISSDIHVLSFVTKQKLNNE